MNILVLLSLLLTFTFYLFSFHTKLNYFVAEHNSMLQVARHKFSISAPSSLIWAFHFSFFPPIHSNNGFVEDFENINTVDIGVKDVDSKIIPDQILLSGYKRGDHSLQEVNTNICQHNNSFIWCLPTHYNQEKHPFTCRNNERSHQFSIFIPTDFHLVNKSLPWDYAFRFVIEEISNINDKAQTMSISM